MPEQPAKRIENRSQIRNYFDLTAWQKARQLTKRVYDLTRKFPHEELYGLVSQLRRAVISIPSNIAERYGRGTRKDYVHFLQNARGSFYEVQTQFILAHDLNFISAGELDGIIGDTNGCSQVLGALIKSLQE